VGKPYVSTDRRILGQMYACKVLPELCNNPRYWHEMIEEKKNMYVLFDIRSKKSLHFIWKLNTQNHMTKRQGWPLRSQVFGDVMQSNDIFSQTV
jgi:hypothetical protein